MKKRNLIVTLFISTIAIYSCNTKPTENNNTENATVANETNVEEPKLNIDSIVVTIDGKRAETEALTVAPVEISTKELRAKIKQKWSKIHFYVQNNEVVKIKTYPHESISKRTEEFYLQNSKLILAVIEDDGTGSKGKSKNELDRMYYFFNDNVINESKLNKESEHGIRNSDSEELLSEAKEYLEIFTANKK